MGYKGYSFTLANALGKSLANIFWENTSLVMTNENRFRALLNDAAIDFIAYHSEGLHDDAYTQVTSFLDSIIKPAIDLITANCKHFDASKDFNALNGFESLLSK